MIDLHNYTDISALLLIVVGVWISLKQGIGLYKDIKNKQ